MDSAIEGTRKLLEKGTKYIPQEDVYNVRVPIINVIHGEV